MEKINLIMTELDYKIYKELLDAGSISKSSIPKSIVNSSTFLNLLNSRILDRSKTGRGFRYFVTDNNEYNKFFKSRFPENVIAYSKSDNIKKFRNSKAKKVENPPVFLLRGFKNVEINEEVIDLKRITKKFGVFSVIPKSVKCERICFVENLEAFLFAEKLIGHDFLLIHKYGRIGQNSISTFESSKFLVFVDYDFNGLDEFLRIKEVFPKAELFVPSNYDDLFNKYSVVLGNKQVRMSDRVKKSTENIVVKIREEVARNNKFLEQEVLLNV